MNVRVQQLSHGGYPSNLTDNHESSATRPLSRRAIARLSPRGFRLIRSVGSLALLPLALACGSGEEDPFDPMAELDSDDIGQNTSAIMNGDSINPEELGVVHLVSGGLSCSGTLVRNNWVLTARHCVNTSLDRAFGRYGGKDLTTFSSVSTDDAAANAVAINSRNGRIAVAGSSEENGKVKFAVAVYKKDGQLDPSFSTDGLVLTDGFLAANEESEALAYDVAFQADGKIVAAGYVANKRGNTRYVAARYNTDGSLDTSFDSDGKWNGTFDGPQRNIGNSLAIAKNGDIVIGGYFVDRDADTKWGIIRLDSTGRPASGFANNGRLVINVASGDERLKDLVIDPFDDDIVAAGWASPGGSTQFAITRVNSNGTMDAKWKGNGATPGTWTTDFGSSTEERALSLDIDSRTGEIYLAGYAIAHGKNRVLALAKYRRTDGQLVKEFGPYGNGKMYAGWDTSEEMRANTIKFDSVRRKVVIAGQSCVGDMFADDGKNQCNLLTARYDTNGVLDPTYHQDGKVSVYYTFATTYSGHGVALDSEGGIVTVGKAFQRGERWMFAIARLLPEHSDVPLLGQETFIMGSQTQTGDRVYMHPTRDVVLVRTQAPFVMNGRTNSYSRSLYSGSTASLNNRTARCVGFGVGSMDDGGEAYLKMRAMDNDVIETGINESNQSLCEGDSGSSCWYNGAIVGVTSAGQHCVDGKPSQFMRLGAAASFRSWFDTTLANN